MTRRPRSATAKPAARVKILVADNQAILVDGVRLLLEKHSGFKVVKAATDGADAVHIAKESRPDVAQHGEHLRIGRDESVASVLLNFRRRLLQAISEHQP